MSYLHINRILITLEDANLRFVLVLSKIIFFLVAKDMFRERVFVDTKEHLFSTCEISIGYGSIFLTFLYLFINAGPLFVTGFSK